jgi:hypothetical protein
VVGKVCWLLVETLKLVVVCRSGSLEEQWFVDVDTGGGNGGAFL